MTSGGRWERVWRFSPAFVLALLAYVPAFTAAPGRMPSDTKLFLYLDPGRLISDASQSWDGRQFGGWVPHQVIAYLWPSGPWYWFWDKVGVPDWIAHRLWLGTLLLLAGIGVRWTARLLGLGAAGALACALVYQLSPYVLPYVSRTSVMLLPFVGLGWVVGLTVRAAETNRWRYASLAALVVVTISAVNATATMMIVPGPVLWLLHAAWQRSVTWRRAVVTSVRIGALSLVVSVWWIAMLVVQGRNGAEVLEFSESLEAVSLTSSSTEVMRGLGYWLFYIRDPVAFTTTASERYMTSGAMVVVSFALLVVCLSGLVATRWAHRRFAGLLVAAGLVLAVGVHPIDDPSPLLSFLAGDSRSSISLAMRSSTRAIPLLLLGLGLGAGALVTALAGRRIGRIRRVPSALTARRRSMIGLGVVGFLAVMNLPALWTGGFVDPALERDQDPPDAWIDAVSALDSNPDGGRVLQLPGQEFGAFRWGYTVDPPLPGLTERPLVTRDLLPLGSPAAMDLLYALDDRMQDGVLDPTAVAPVARLLGADTVWLTGDVAFERFRSARPEITSDEFHDSIPGLGSPTDFGTAIVNVPEVPMVDEESVSNPLVGTPVAPVSLVPVLDPTGVVRAKTSAVVVLGSGDGVVDAAAAGVLDGRSLVLYAGSLDDAALADALDAAGAVVITDSNRPRAHHWRSSQDVKGFTEDGSGTGVLEQDSADQRVEVFPVDRLEDRTIALQVGPVTAHASQYGEPFAYRPEDRAVMAIDGDDETAWTVGDRFDPLGQYLQLTATEPVGSLRLVQPLDADANRWITSVRVILDPGTAQESTTMVALDESSRTPKGQTIELIRSAETVRLVVDAVGERPRPESAGLDGVGFAEVDTGLGPTEEIVRLPTRGWDTTKPTVIVLTRERVAPTDRWRDDPERSMVRSIELPAAMSLNPGFTALLDARASDDVLASLLGVAGTRADRRLTGVISAAGWAATDGVDDTSWQSPFGQAVGATLDVPTVPGAALGPITVTQRIDAEHSRITALTLSTGGTSATVELPTPDGRGRSTIRAKALRSAGLPATSGESLAVTVAAVEAHTTNDRRTAELVELPVAITGLSGQAIEPTRLPTTVDTGCRDDLLSIDGEPVSLSLSGATADLLTGGTFEVSLCDGGSSIDLDAGEHVLRTTTGSGIDIDRVVLRNEIPIPSAGVAPTVTVTERSGSHRRAVVGPCPTGCWFVQGEGHNVGWNAELDGQPLGEPTVVDGGFNGWWLPPSDAERVVDLDWAPQSTMRFAYIVTVLGLLLCLVILVLDRGPAASSTAAARPMPARLDARLGRRQALAATAALTVSSALLIAWPWALAGLVVGAFGFVVLRRSWIVGLVGLAGVSLIGVTMLRRVLLYRQPANAAWPAQFEDLHRFGLFAILAVASCTIVTDAVVRRRARP